MKEDWIGTGRELIKLLRTTALPAYAFVQLDGDSAPFVRVYKNDLIATIQRGYLDIEIDCHIDSDIGILVGW